MIIRLVLSTLLLTTSQAPAKVVSKSDISFVRYLDAGGNESFRVTCVADCLLEFSKNSRVIKQKTIPLSKAQKFTKQFAANIAYAKERLPPTRDRSNLSLEWRAETGEKILQGAISQKTDIKRLTKTIDAVAILEVQLWLELNK